jgi:hypothetical protein
VLGFIQPKREHVHLTHLERNRPVNPLARGHLAPYRDTTSPKVLGISARNGRAGVSFVVSVVDTPSLPVPGRWHGFPVTPALVTLRVERAGRLLVAEQVVWDVRALVSRNDRFWTSFARGTHQNWPIFAGRKQQGRPGTYLLRTRPLAARVLGVGTCVVVVSASDTAGNDDVHRFRFRLESP